MRRAAVLMCAAALAFPAGAQPAPARQSWIVYAGGYTARSAMDALSVVRTGNIARFTQFVVSATTQWQSAGMPFDYFIATVEYDCAARSARSIRNELFDRNGKSLKASDHPDAEFASGANASEFIHFAPVACRDPANPPPKGSYDTLAGFLAGNAHWNLPPKR
jgi:hypothetical protein